LKLTQATLFFLYSICLVGCISDKGVPPEVNLALQQEANLWRAEANLYLPDQYAKYKESFTRARINLLKTNSQFFWLRDYGPIQMEFIELLRQGEDLYKILQVEKQRRAISVLDQLKRLRDRLENLSKLTLMLNSKEIFRINLIKAEIVMNEAEGLYKRERFFSSEKKLTEVETYLIEVENGLSPILNRYRDLNLISKWGKWAREMIEESRRKEAYGILIVKSEKKLLLYKKGEPVKRYPIGLGKSGLLMKRHAKDHATPEGKYRIIGKNPRSRFYKALLINYPNENDWKEFKDAKKKGLLKKGIPIGGLIEIHGGGKEGLTYGCISMDNGDIEELYSIVDIGTPVTIIGALEERNSLSTALTKMEKNYGKDNIH